MQLSETAERLSGIELTHFYLRGMFPHKRYVISVHVAELPR